MKVSIPHQNPHKKLSNITHQNMTYIDNKNLPSKYKPYPISTNLTPKYHGKSNNKNFIQSQSTSILPYFIHKDRVNNDQSYTKKQKKSITEISNKDGGYQSGTKISGGNMKGQHEDILQSRKISEQNTSDKMFEGFIRQTTEPNLGSQIQQMKFYQHYKAQILDKRSRTPIEIKKISKEKRVIQLPKQGNAIPRFLQTKQASGQKNNEKQIYMRQTIDSKVQKAFQQPKSKNVSPLFIRTHGKKDRSNSIDKKKATQRLQKNKNVSTLSSGNFWKNRAVSPPVKLPSQKQNGNDVLVKIPILPLQQTFNEAHRPSFLSHKKTLSRFNIMKQLSNSNHCDVFLCIEKKSNTIFCLKRYQKILMKNSPQLLDNLIKKVAFKLLAEHPNIIQMYDIFSEGEFVYTIEEYMEGGKLNQYIDKQLKEKQSKKIYLQLIKAPTSKQNQEVLVKQVKIIEKIFQINSALCYLHQNHLITSSKDTKRKLNPMAHGNIRTNSIMVNIGVCKLPAFYPSSMINDIKADSPPEQILQKVYVPKSDIWCLGLVLYELCAQKPLVNTLVSQNKNINATDYPILNMNIPQQIQKLSNTTQLVKDLLKKLFAIKLEDRPTSDIIMNSTLFRMYGFDNEPKQPKQFSSKSQNKSKSKSHNSSFTDLKRKLFSDSETKQQYTQSIKQGSKNDKKLQGCPSNENDSPAKGLWFPKSHTNLIKSPK